MQGVIKSFDGGILLIGYALAETRKDIILMKHPVCRLLTRSWESWCEEAVCSPSSHYNLLSGGTKSDFIFMMELLARSQKRNEPRSSTGCFSISINKSILFPFLSFPLHAGARRGGSVNLLRAGKGGTEETVKRQFWRRWKSCRKSFFWSSKIYGFLFSKDCRRSK